MPKQDERLAWAEAKTRECRKIALRYFGTRLRVERKADRSPVTIADRTIEEHLRRELARAFPSEAVVGEEFGSPQSLGSSYWTIDPIDGTRAFSRGLPSWGMLIAWVERGEPTVGACDLPVLKTFFGAGRGVAYERSDGRRKALPLAREPSALADTVLFHGGSSWWLTHRLASGFKRLVQSCFLERAYGDCYAYLWVFRNHVDAMIDYGVKIWDIAPFASMAKATGRVLVNFSGKPDFIGPETILAPPSLARLIVNTLQPPSTSNRQSAKTKRQ